MRAAREHHQPLLRRQRDRVPGRHLDARNISLEPGQGLLQAFRFPPRPSLFTCFARAIASAPGGTSSVMTDPAPIHAWSPIETGATNVLSTPS